MSVSRFLAAIAIAAVLAPAAARASARPCAGVSADAALAAATLIVKGRLESTRSEGVPESDSTSVIRVDRVLKGVTARREISVTYFLCGLEYSAAMRKDRPLIAFVTASGGLVSGTAVLPASRQTVAPLSLDAEANLRAEFLLGSADDDPVVVRAAIGALAELDGSASSATLKQATKNTDLGVRVRALTWLTRFGDAEAFRELAGILSEGPVLQSATHRIIRDVNDASLAIAYDDVIRSLSSFAERNFGVSTTPRVNGPAFVETMAMLARSSDIYTRRAAFEALRGFKDRASFPILVEALDDQDQYIRYHAMFTLCMAMNAPDLPCPAVSLFHGDEQKYINRIRAWWKSQQ